MSTDATTNDNLQLVYDVPLEVTAVLGGAKMSIANIVKLARGSVIELNKKVGEPIDLFVNGKIVARGEIVLVGPKIGITITEIIKK